MTSRSDSPGETKENFERINQDGRQRDLNWRVSPLLVQSPRRYRANHAILVITFHERVLTVGRHPLGLSRTTVKKNKSKNA